MSSPVPLHVVDSHTGGEPTRVVIDGLPRLETGTAEQQRDFLAEQADWVRTALTQEPRGAEWMVGAALLPPTTPDQVAGVVFFNNRGYLGMCGHGLIGVVTTLHHLGRLEVGPHLFDTPVGSVAAELHADGSVSFENVVSFRSRASVAIEVPGLGEVVGDVAYGGNWFFLVPVPTFAGRGLDELTAETRQIMAALEQQQVVGRGGATIDHVELVGPPSSPAQADARNFVLCPGGQYDRSPCGTGTSAKLACLAADNRLFAGEEWRQESITGSLFRGSYRETDGGILPTIQGQAYVTGELTVIIDERDPFGHGRRSEW
ncbi:MAG: proline racemase family protein [Planctomycetota bacterium]